MRNFIRLVLAVFLIISLVLMAGCVKKEAVKKEEKSGPAKQISAQILSPEPTELNQPAPAKFQVKFETSQGDFVVEVYRDWSPFGADRFYYLVKSGFYDGVRFFRIIEGFMAQFGYHGDPNVIEAWQDLTIPDDPVKQSNLRGYVSFAKGQFPNSRTTQLFINYVNNSRLDGYGFSPIGKVIDGMDVVDQLYNGYGEGAPSGKGPSQQLIQQGGNEYLNKNFPELDYIKKARIL